MLESESTARSDRRAVRRLLNSSLVASLLSGGLWVGFSTIAAPAAQAATLTVTSLNPDSCTSPTPGSLRAEIAAASPGDTITFSPSLSGVITLACPLQITEGLTISGPGPGTILISGAGSFRVFVVGDVTAKISGVTIENGFAGGVDSSEAGANSGGGIMNLGTLALSNCVVTGNSSGSGGDGAAGSSSSSEGGPGGGGGTGGNGGGIYSQGSLTVKSCTINGNSTGNGGSGGNGGSVLERGSGGNGGAGGYAGSGGGIYSASGTLTVTDSTISGNSTGNGGNGGNGGSGPEEFGSGGVGGAGGDGGGVFVLSGNVTITNSTISGNTSGNGGSGGNGGTGAAGGKGGSGGGFETASFASTVSDATISGNKAGSGGPGGTGTPQGNGLAGSAGQGGGIYDNGSNLTLFGSIFAQNVSTAVPGSNCDGGSISDAGYNVSDDDTCVSSATSLRSASDPSIGLGSLQYNGGPPWITTEAIPSTSVAASLVASGCPSTDERLYARPNTQCASGAEDPAGVAPVPVPVVPPTGQAIAPSAPVDLTGTDGQITLSWQPPISSGTSPVTSYEVFRFTATTAATQIAKVLTPTTTYVDTNVTPGVTYSYYVEATNAFGNSPPSNVVSVTAPAAPSGPCSSYSGNAAFVCALYEDILGRAPDSSGLSYWLSQLSSGASWTQVAYAIATSTEYQTDFIEADYMAFLGRPADPGGLATWLSAFSSGATDEQIDAGILGSTEFFTDAGGTTSGFINAVYQDLLGRPVDSAGLSTWSSALNSGWTWTQVAYAIDTSNESRTDTIQFFYQTLLNRPADASGLSTWLVALNSGATDEQVLAAIAGSQEFYDDATGT